MSLPPAMLIDLDDTIIDDTSSSGTCWDEAVAAACAKVEGLTPAVLRHAIAEYNAWFWADPDRHRAGRANLRAASTHIVAEALRKCGVEDRDLAAATANHYRDLRETRTCLFPGATEALAGLRARGIRLALITNGDAAGQRRKIERFGLACYFDHILIEGEFGAGKPEERVYYAAAQAIDAKPADAWIIGDNLEWEIAVPARLGFYTVWLDSAGRGLPANVLARPHRIIGGLPELLA